MTIAELTGPAGDMPALLALTESGAWASPLSGVVGAASAGYLVGNFIEWSYEKAFGEMPADTLYNWLHPEDRMPAYDPSKNCAPRVCK
jgi:hypothetical protein